MKKGGSATTRCCLVEQLNAHTMCCSRPTHPPTAPLLRSPPSPLFIRGLAPPGSYAAPAGSMTSVGPYSSATWLQRFEKMSTLLGNACCQARTGEVQHHVGWDTKWAVC